MYNEFQHPHWEGNFNLKKTNRLTLAIQDQYMMTQSDYLFHHQIEMEARHQQHVDRFGNRGGVIMV